MSTNRHHRLGGSGAHRYFNCAASIPLAEQAREAGLIEENNSSSAAARLGTVVHKLSEQCLITDMDPEEFLHTKISTEGCDITITAKMVEDARIYVNVCREQMRTLRAEFTQIEYPSELSHLFEGEDVGGACDFVCCGSQVLAIIDYKNGTYPVEVQNNPQALKYALGVYEQLKNKFNIETIRLIIVQPNARNGAPPVKTQDLSVQSLTRWCRRTLKPAVTRVQEVTKLIKAGTPVEELPDDLKPRADKSWCHFCPVAGLCATYAKLNKQLVFSDTQHSKLPAPHVLTLEEAENIILNKAAIVKWLTDVYEYRKAALKAGETSQKFKLVDSLGNREIVDPKRAVRRLQRWVPRSELFRSDLHSPSTLENLLYKYRKQKDPSFTYKAATLEVSALCERTLRGQSLVPIENPRTAQPPISAAEEFAQDEKTNLRNSRRKRQTC